METRPSVNAAAEGFAKTRNILVFAELMERGLNRPPHLPGLLVYHGPSGLGKSFSAAHAAGRYNAYYVEARSTWTPKGMLEAILRQLGVMAGRTNGIMQAQVAEQLARSRRPLIIDETDHVVARNLIELVRDLYEETGATIVLIGEEMLPHKLQRWERVAGRVLDWAAARPADLDDAQKLARFYCPSLEIADPFLQRLILDTHGSLRRICVNLDKVREIAVAKRLKAFSLDDWGNTRFNTGAAPQARTFKAML